MRPPGLLGSEDESQAEPIGRDSSLLFCNRTTARTNESLLLQFIHTVADIFELALLNQRVPNFLRILVRRRDGDDVGCVSLAQRTTGDFRILVKPSQLQAFLECLE